MSKSKSTVVPIQSLDAAVRAIHVKFAGAIESDNKGWRYRLAAGQMLLDLRKRIEAGEAGVGVNWWQWYESKFVRSRRDAEKVMKLARAENPEAAAEAEQAEDRERKRQSRAAQPEDDDGESLAAADKADVRRSNDEEEQPEDGAAAAPSPVAAPVVHLAERQQEYDLVDHAFRLVEEMNAEQRERFVAKLKEFFRW